MILMYISYHLSGTDLSPPPSSPSLVGGRTCRAGSSIAASTEAGDVEEGGPQIVHLIAKAREPLELPHGLLQRLPEADRAPFPLTRPQKAKQEEQDDGGELRGHDGPGGRSGEAGSYREEDTVDEGGTDLGEELLDHAAMFVGYVDAHVLLVGGEEIADEVVQGSVLLLRGGGHVGHRRLDELLHLDPCAGVSHLESALTMMTIDHMITVMIRFTRAEDGHGQAYGIIQQRRQLDAQLIHEPFPLAEAQLQPREQMLTLGFGTQAYVTYRV